MPKVPDSSERRVPQGAAASGLSEVRNTIRRAFAEFLALPTIIIAAFLLAGLATYVLDRTRIEWLEPLRAVLKTRVFTDGRATSALLGTIATGLITVTSITVSLLLLAVQQAAASMTAEVIDQFLRRRYNQVYFGFFIGLALFALVTLATVADPFNPVFGATIAFLLTIVALSLLLLLLYTTINQMRPVEVINHIHDQTIAARVLQLSLVRRTRRTSRFEGAITTSVRAVRRGFVTRIDVDALHEAASACQHETEVILPVSVGSYAAFQDVLGVVQAGTHEDAERMARAVEQAIHLERQRDVTADPVYGLEQLEAIAWTSISSSKSNPAPGLLVIRTLRNMLAVWSLEEAEPPEGPLAPVVYADDTVARLMSTFESLAVVSTESMQHQIFSEVVRTFAVMFDRLPAEHQPRAEDVLSRIISGLGDHVLTAELDGTLSALVDALTAAGRHETARAIAVARERLHCSVGTLHSRSTRST